MTAPSLLKLFYAVPAVFSWKKFAGARNRTHNLLVATYLCQPLDYNLITTQVNQEFIQQLPDSCPLEPQETGNDRMLEEVSVYLGLA